MTIAKYEPYQPPCCSLFEWQQKVMTDWRGVKHYRMRDSSGNVHANSGECFSENDLKMRGIFLGLGLAIVPFVPLVRLPLRIYSLFCGDFATFAHAEATEEQEVEWLKYAKAELEKPGSGSPPSEHLFNCTVLLYSLRNLALDIVKIILYPLASIALLFAGLWAAIVDPADGGKMWSTIEHLLDQGPRVRVSGELFMCLQWLMPCQQSEATRKTYRLSTFEKGLYKTIFDTERLLQNNKGLLSAVGINIQAHLQSLQTYKEQTLPAIATTLKDESGAPAKDKYGYVELRLTHNVARHRHSQAIEAYSRHFNALVSFLRNSVIGMAQRHKLQDDNTTSRYNNILREELATSRSLESWTEHLRLPPTDPLDLLFYTIEKELQEHEARLSPLGVKVDELLNTMGHFLAMFGMPGERFGYQREKKDELQAWLTMYTRVIERVLKDPSTSSPVSIVALNSLRERLVTIVGDF